MTEWIVTSSVLVFVVVALRYLLRGKISLRLQYALWALVLIRLLVPFSLVQSPISVMNAVEEINTLELSVTADEIGSDFSNIEYVPSTGVINGYYAGDYDRDFPTVIAPEATEQQFNQLEKAVEAKDVLVPIWLAGVGVMLAVFLISNLRFGFMLRRERRMLDIPGSIVPVYISSRVETPCLFGFFRPAIYVTEDCAGDESVLRHVLAHESTHYRHGDNIWAVLRCLCLALHWYNPLVWLAAFLSRRDAELACDEGAIKRLGEAERMNYGRTLIGLTCQDVAAKGLVLTATTMTGSKKSIRERIMLIAKKPKMALYTLVAVLLVSAVAVGCTFSGAESGFTDRDAKKEAKSLAADCAHSNYLQLMDNPEILRYKGEDDKDKYIRVSYPLKNDERHIVVFLNMCDANGNYLDEPYSAEVILSNSGLPIIGDPELVSSVSMWADGRANPEIPPEHEAELLDYLTQLEYGELWPPQIAGQMPSDTYGFTVYYADGSSMSFGLNSISLPGDIYYQIQRPGEPNWLSDIIMGVNTESGEVPESDQEPPIVPTPPAMVISELLAIEPYLHLAHSKEWTENGWLMSDGKELTAQYIESISAEIPTINYSPDLALVANTGLWYNLDVYDQNFQPIHVNGEYGYEGLTALRWLTPGTYYCVFGIYGELGDYIESEGEYEESAYHCIFRLNVKESIFNAQGFDSYTGWDIDSVFISSSNGTLDQVNRTESITELERILSTAKDMGFVGACGYGQVIYLMGEGGTIAICPAGDDCSNFFSDGKCWEISDADMAAMMEIFSNLLSPTPLAAVTSHGSSVAPYEHLVFSKEWTENGWLSADGLALTPEYIQSIADKIPEVHLNYDFNITISTGLRSPLTVYDEDFQPVHSEDDYYYGFTAVNWLRPGEYYCVFGVYGPEGEYIESQGEYEESAYQCVFRLIVDGAGYVAKAFSPYDCNSFDFATYSANGKYFTISAPDAMDTLEAILSRATETFLPACPFGSTINIHRSGGGTIAICPAEDSCSVFFSDGKCWELSNADMAAMMEIFNTSGISTPASSSHYYAHIARFEAVAQNHVQALLSDMIGAEDEYMGKIINTKVYMLNFLYLGLKEDTIACELHYAFEYENPDPMLLGYAAEGSGEYEGMWITSYNFKLELQPDGTWEQYTYDGWEPFHSEFEWGYVPVYSAEFIGEELTCALQNNKPDLLMRILPLIDFSAITAEQLEPLYELVQKAAVGTDQLYRDLYVMRAAPNTDGAYTDLMASTLYRQYLADSVAFDEALSYLSTDEQNFIMELLEYAKG